MRLCCLHRTWWRSFKPEHVYDDVDDDDERESHLEVKFFSFITVWYIVSACVL